MNHLPILTDLFKEINENVMHTIYLTMQVILYKVLEVKFQEQTNEFVKI